LCVNCVDFKMHCATIELLHLYLSCRYITALSTVEQRAILSPINLVLCTHSFYKLNFNPAFPPMPFPLISLLTFKFSNWNGACVSYFSLAGYNLLPIRCKIPGDQNSKYPNSANFKSLITST
jgi:hypothetical protein